MEEEKTNKFFIKSINDLIFFRDEVNSGTDFLDEHIVQLCPFENLDNWIPIGTKEHPFRGTYSGQNETIKKIMVQNNETAGLFGYIENAIIEDVILEQGAVIGEAAAGICAVMIKSTVQRCQCGVSIAVHNTQGFSGGIAGYNDGGIIKDCVFMGKIESQSVYGGICGKNYGTISGCTLMVNMPGIGEGNPGDIHLVYEESIICYKGTGLADQCTIKVNCQDTLRMIRKKLEIAGFIIPDDQNKHIGYRFLMMSVTEISTTLSDIVIGISTEGFINYNAALHPLGHHLILTNLYKEEQFDLVGFPTKKWENRHLQICCRLNKKDAEAKKVNEGLFEPMMLQNVLFVEPTMSYETLKNVCVCCEGSAVELELKSWGAVGFNYNIELSNGSKIVNGLCLCYGNKPSGYRTSKIRRWHKEKKIIQIVGKKSIQLSKGKDVDLEQITFKSRAIYEYTRKGITYKSSDLPPALTPNASKRTFKSVSMSYLSTGSNTIIDIPGESIESGIVTYGEASEQNWGSGISKWKMDPWEKNLGEVSVSFLVFKTLEEARKVIGVLNAI